MKIIRFRFRKLFVTDGFTLLELLLVVGIIGILSTSIVLNGLGYRNRQALDLAAQQMAASIRDAQNRSVSQQDGLAWGVYFNNVSSTDSYTVFSGGSYSASENRFVTSLDSPVEFTIPSAGTTSSIVFAQVSGLPSTSTSVTITNGSASTTITISANGQVQF
jgi:prepilin-type N-terminal cleavage/methylation domain-containing protein